MKIGIRADGGSKIGMGHIMRTLVLAKELSENHQVFYICLSSERTVHNFLNINSLNIIDILNKDKYRNGIEKIINEGFKVKLIREKFIIEDLKKIEADLLITDSYNVDEGYFNKTKKIFSKTAYIDDLNLYHFNVDFLINQNVNALDFNYSVNSFTKLLLGPKYIMLREEFIGCERRNINRKVKDIMITMGGADSNGITKKILTWIYSMPYKFHVVIGPSFTNVELLKAFENKNVKLYFKANMKEIMLKCDLAICACGSTLYELASLGIPALGIILADNQEAVAQKLNSMKIIKNLGWCSNLTKDYLIDMIENLCRDYNLRLYMSQNASSMIDGYGVQRLVACLTEEE
ncbi:UDP-2,4-diacetamido-2,4,6-trideoxy-beta-L-altropyranose hydrolase [Clostridium sp. P21]|uniref:UDP-2,4-diacetamido-2,4, 6-trideoxy-beta-L-altropyranose hydrolase n=1 Tax=Clostridium muellerianum TaxID=2716538 RepID=A0A7Y0HNC8_9CLOT|nr:UDP-2,4-diacetamido-2,4,6-trideoxy-beta-L-altropyranose hydrolase [Clostridium muellerianum]NMM61473.1 UDP-2,4-diacetamido-2,4,6-trideoxy-beta-L-altropyranose hydrolase [Clostridium muellerianum]